MKQNNHFPILIIGAGIAGLTAAALLQEAGLPAMVLDKGRGVGGRMATRRFGNGRFDHGAQYFTAREETFRQQVAAWQAAGVAGVWAHGFAAGDEAPVAGHPRYCGVTGMTAVPKHLAGALDVRLQTRVTAVIREENHWLAQTESGQQFRGQALLLTPPVPQSLALLATGQVHLPVDIERELQALTYNPCLALMVLLAGPSRLPAPGGLRPENSKIAWIADNHQKGISPDGHAVTIHATPAYSRRRWADDAAAIAAGLLQEASTWLGPEIVEWQLHRWRYAQPTTTYAQPALLLPGAPAVAFAGDAFGGPRVEGAALSGQAAAQALLSSLS